MATQQFVNNFATTVAAPFGAASTILQVTSTSGLPTLTNGDFFLFTLYRLSGTIESGHEVVKVTAINGNACTVIRSFEGAAPSAFAVGDSVEVRLTSKGILAKADITYVDTQDALKAPLNGVGANGTWNISVLGNSNTASKLSVARTINGVPFDGSANIVLVKADLSLGSVDNTSDTNKPVSTAQRAALDLKSDITYVDTKVSSVVNSAPDNLNTLGKLATAIGNDPNYASNTSAALGYRLRVDIPNQVLSAAQKLNALTNLGHELVENKSSATIRSELTYGNITTALAYTPVNKSGDTINGVLNIATGGSIQSLTVTDTGANGANIKLVGDGAVTPNKTLRSRNGIFEIINSTYSNPIFALSDAGDITKVRNITAASYSGAGTGLTGTAAGLSIGGNATTASSVTWAGVSGKPTTVAGLGLSDFTVSIIPGGNSQNLNGYWKAGIYRTNENNVNVPTVNATYGNMLTVNGGSDTFGQLFISYSDGESYTRGGTVNGAITPWRTLMYDGGNYGTISLNNWFRSTGESGWFNATYNGGIYMTDSTWVRTYNNKGILCGDMYATGNVVAYSDERVKTNWRDTNTDFIERWSEIKKGTYDRIDQTKTQVGTSAQDVQAILPHAVIEVDGKLSLNYGGAAIVATVKLAERAVEHANEIKMLYSIIEDLTHRIKQLENKP